MPETSSPSIPAGRGSRSGYRASIVIAAVLFLLDLLVFAGLLIPVFAAYVVLWGVPQGDIKPATTSYRYWQDDTARYLSYVLPPWPIRRIYDFQTRRWRIDD